ncbi:MAG: DUF1080 domain-containing protein [Rubrivivax sp.]|nr:DUF1080 domain-containing protein [Rubrivivax sp.]
MQRRQALFTALAAAGLVLSGCASGPADGGWTTLIDGDKGLDNWNAIGNANWRAEAGAIVADKGVVGFLVSKQSYKDFAIRAEFWAATDTNSGIFLRLSDAKNITADNSYEVNIWDIRPDPKYGTGGIVNFAAVPVPPVFLAGGRWNVYEIEARGPRVTVKLNGATTVTMNNDKFAAGPFALQFGPGVQGVVGGPIKWRKVQVKAL